MEHAPRVSRVEHAENASKLGALSGARRPQDDLVGESCDVRRFVDRSQTSFERALDHEENIAPTFATEMEKEAGKAFLGTADVRRREDDVNRCAAVPQHEPTTTMGMRERKFHSLLCVCRRTASTSFQVIGVSWRGDSMTKVSRT